LETLPEQPGQVGLPEADMISFETNEELLASLMNLDERERDLLSLKFAARLTNRRIADISGLSEANVGVIIFRALKKLRAELAAYK
jgi:RNA polymerase sigma-70 factor (ECF subfamily)